MKKIFITCVRVILLSTLATSSQIFADQFASVADRLPVETGLYKPGLLSKADTSLARAVEEYSAHIGQGRITEFKPSSKFLQIANDSILIDARATSDGGDLLNDLEQLGLTRGARYGDVVSGLLPFAAMETAVELPSLRSITASPRPIAHAGSITSQGDAALRADMARTVHGVDGTGVTVGVISDSYDTLGGAATDIASSDLPTAGVPVLNGESTLCGVLVFCVDEGRAMLQIIHDLAPGAALLFQSGIDGIASYANAISNMAASGADIIVDDLLILNEPMFQDGIIAQAVDSAVASGVSYFTAAGNSGRQSYEAAFDDSGEVFCIEFFDPIGDCDPLFERVGRMHDFDPGPGVDNYQSITIPENTAVTIAMQWDQPFGGAGPDNDHDIVLLDGTGQTYIAISANDHIAMGEGWEALQYDNSEFLGNGTDFTIIITYDDVDSVGPPATLLKLVVFGEGVTLNEYATNSGALFGHPNAAGAEAVGAAFFMDTPANGTSPPMLETYSSAGGTPILFDIDGTPLPAPVIRPKPEITAVDGVNTTFFFDDSYGSDGIDDFFGTSAAAPHAAGVAALLLEARPGASPYQVNTVLENTAVDMGTAGFDYDSGFGLIQADAAIAAMLATFPIQLNGIVGLADISSNSIPEVGVVVPGSTRVHIRDASTGALISNLNFGDDPAIDMEVIPDLDGSGNPEIAILGKRPSGQMRAFIKDSVTGAIVATPLFGSQYIGVDMTVLADYSGNGLPELAVMGQDATDRIRVQVKDPATDTELNNLWYGTTADAHSVITLPDVTGNAIEELFTLGVVKSNGFPRGQVRDPSTTLYHKTTFFNSVYTPVKVIALPDIDASGDAEVAELGQDPVSNTVLVQVRDATVGAPPIQSMFLGSENTAIDMVTIDDTNGNGKPDIAVLLETPGGTALVKVRDSLTGINILNIFYGSVTSPKGIAVLDNYADSAAQELAVLGENSGIIRVQIKDALSGAQINNVDYP